jgi:hypothetical protein
MLWAFHGWVALDDEKRLSFTEEGNRVLSRVFIKSVMGDIKYLPGDDPED